MRDGDVVKEINGVALNNVAKTIQFLNGLRQESSVSVAIMRDGASVQLDMNVK
jgi:type II secretory pathway component PulC